MTWTINSNNTLVVTGDRNSSNKNDFTGSFDPEAKAFMKLYGIASNRRLNVNLANKGFESPLRKKQVLDFIMQSATLPNSEKLGCLAVFCHGLNSKIEIGFGTKHIPELVQSLVSIGAKKDLLVLLYCCSTGAISSTATGDGSFADKLRDELCKAGLVDCRVVAHTVAGHTTRNPMKRLFDGMGSPLGGVGGLMVVSPTTQKAVFAKWRTALADNKTLFRFKFPVMSVADIHKMLVSL